MLWAAAVSMVASGLFAATTAWTLSSLVTAIGLFVSPIDGSAETTSIFACTRTSAACERHRRPGRIEFSRWDPISKIDVIIRIRSDELAA